MRKLTAAMIGPMLLALAVAAVPTAAEEPRQYTPAERAKIEQLRKTMGLRSRNTEVSTTREAVPDLGKPAPRRTESATEPTPEPEADGFLDISIYFRPNDDTITAEARPALDALGGALADPEFRGDRWVVEGHTDAQGDDGYNRDLSYRRARAVYDYLIKNYQVGADQLYIIGKGEAELIDAADPVSARNRRVRIKYLCGSHAG